MTEGTSASQGIPGNRRIDRVLAADYLEGIAGLPLDQVRTMRREAEQEEVDLSYLRRLVQGRLDILRAELRRRSGESAGDLVDELPQILTDEGVTSSPRGMGRHSALEPSRADSHRRHVEQLVADVDISDLGSHDEESLQRCVQTLEREEHEVSQSRRSVQTVMDACTAEMTRRYREGDADVSDLLPTDASG
jgi:anti-sigma-K factor RsiG